MAISGGMISNPKRSVSVDMNINRIRKMVKNLYKVYTSIDHTWSENKEDDFTNTYSYKVKEGGLSFGARAVITLKKVDENTTNVEVEMQRQVGSYDTDYEVSESNKQLEAIFSALSALSTKTEEELDTLVVNETEQIETGIGGFGTALMVIAFIVGMIFIITA
jgi:hypothetical protein